MCMNVRTCCVCLHVYVCVCVCAGSVEPCSYSIYSLATGSCAIRFVASAIGFAFPPKTDHEHGNDAFLYRAIRPDCLMAVLWHFLSFDCL